MESNVIYRDRADLYDLIYHWKDYDAEVLHLRALLAAAGLSPGARLLEAACGTGRHLAGLAEAGFEVAGFDLNAGMLTAAARRPPLKGAPLFLADMSEFQVGEPFDALLCLFSSIGYLAPERLPLAATCFAAALRPGGALIVEPWFTPDTFRAGKPSLQTYESPDLKIARGCVAELEGRRSRTDMHDLVLPRGGAVDRFEERHDLWLTPISEMLAIFEGAGFEIRYEPEGLMPGRGLYLGRLR